MSKPKKRILFVSSEMAPFLESPSDLANISRVLPQAIQEQDNEIRILVPRFGLINERRNRLHEVVRLSGINISIDDNDNPLIIKVASIPQTKMQVYFLDNEDYFHRKAVYEDEDGKFFEDNDERTIFFCKGVLETVKKLGWAPDVIHCQGWMTSLIPLYLKTIYKNEPVFKNAVVIYGLFDHDKEYNLGADFARKASLNEIEDDKMQCVSCGNLKKLHISAVQHADAVVTVDDITPEVAQVMDDKPNMKHSDEEIGSRYVTFYEQVMSKVN